MKKHLCVNWKYLMIAALLSYGTPLSAQVFEDVPAVKTTPAVAPALETREKRFNNSWANPRSSTSTSENSIARQDKTPDNVNQPLQKNAPKSSDSKVTAQDARRNAAEALSKSLEGKRGYKAINRVVTRANMPKEDDSLIFLFYKDFSVSKTMGGTVMCDVKFIIMSTLENKISNISLRLKWPKIETTLSFNEVQPNVENYYNYTLVGEGCYSMDKIPNIIVNRCRVKGLSQAECANKIRWLKK